MQPPRQSRELRVTSRHQALALENALRANVLAACIPCERSLTELSELTDEPLPKLHYHVERLLAAGLLAVSRERLRAGRPVRYFRAKAACFVVPQDLSRVLPGDKLAQELRTELQRRRHEVVLRYAADAEGRLEVRMTRAVPSPRSLALELWHILSLTPRQRDNLAAELTDLFSRYASLSEGTEMVLAHAAFVTRSRDGRVSRK